MLYSPKVFELVFFVTKLYFVLDRKLREFSFFSLIFEKLFFKSF